MVRDRGWLGQGGLAWVLGMGGVVVLGLPEPALAQLNLVPDTEPGLSLGTQVTNDVVVGGTPSGANLFHSFAEFNVPENRTVIFNSGGFENILSRVTGSDPSDILGTLGVNGTANLFLLNPNGITFGPNAQLALEGGSFVATTANAIGFPTGGEFSTTSTVVPGDALLTVNPSALFFNETPAGAIVNQSIVGLEVTAGENLFLVGGEVRLEGGVIRAPGGRVELGGLAEAGNVSIEDITNDGSNSGLNFPDVELNFFDGVKQANVALIDASIDVNSPSDFAFPGDISIRAGEQLSLVNSQLTSRSENALTSDFGVIQLIATEGTIGLNQSTLSTSNFGSGLAGDIIINAAKQIIIENQSSIFSNGRAGRIFIEAREQVSLVNSELFTESEDDNTSDLFSLIEIAATEGSVLLDQATLSTTNTSSGFAGDISISARDEIIIQNQSEVNSDGNFGRIFLGKSDVFEDSLSPERIEIINSDLTTNNDGSQADTSESIPAGDISIVATDRILLSSSSLQTVTGRTGDAGEVTLRTNSGTIHLSNNSNIFSTVESGGIGQGGSILIETGTLSLTGGSQVQTLVRGNEDGQPGQGDAGNVTIQAQDDITLTGVNALGNPSAIFSSVGVGATGNGGNIRISTGSLSSRDRGLIDTSLFGTGIPGSIFIEATDAISLTAGASISSVIGEEATASAGTIPFDIPERFDDNGSSGRTVGTILIDTDTLSLRDNSQINASTFGVGDAGAVLIVAEGEVTLENGSGIFSGVADTATGEAGGILMAVESLSIDSTPENPSGLTTSTFGQGGNPGLIFVIAHDDISISGGADEDVPILDDERSGIFSVVGPSSANDGQNTGAILLFARDIFLKDGAEISVDNQGEGEAGGIFIGARDLILLNQGEVSALAASGVGGAIVLELGDFLLLLQNSAISTQAGSLDNPGDVDGGDITLDQRFLIAAPFASNDLDAEAFGGPGGRIEITADRLYDIEERPLTDFSNDISATSGVGEPGEVSSNVLDVDPTQGLTNLPANPVDPSTLIAETCAPRGGLAEGERNQFIVTGRGGLPPDPNAAFPGEAVVDDVGLPQEESPVDDSSSANPASGEMASSQVPDRIEAQGWVYGEDGKIIFTAQAHTVTPSTPALIPASTCHDVSTSHQPR